MKLLINVDGRPGELILDREAERCRFEWAVEEASGVSGEASVVQVEPGIYSILVNGCSYEVKVVNGPEGYYADLGGRRSVVQVHDRRAVSKHGKHGMGEGRQTVIAPMPGKVIRVLVREGAEVQAGDGLVVVEAMKMQNELKAPRSGRVVSLKAEVGATVGMGEMLAAIE